MSNQFLLGILVATILLISPAHLLFGDDAVWTDIEQRVTYKFLENHQFEYSERFKVKSGDKYVWGKAKKAEGAWQVGRGICWLGKKGEGKEGNLLVFVGEMQCCFGSEMLGKNRILTKIWRKNSVYLLNICTNRVLRRLPGK